MPRRSIRGLGAVVVGLLMASAVQAASPADIEFFEKRIRPLLANNCQECHGSKQQKGGLRLDSRAALMRGGDSGPALVPGQSADSLLMDAVEYDPFGYQMPPKGKLPAEQIADLATWINAGAPWPGGEDAPPLEEAPTADAVVNRRETLWSFQPLAENTPPDVKRTEWPRGAIDQFILARLEAAGLQPAPRADRAALLRRLSFDLIGLPPTREELAAFLADDSPDAYEKQVDRLLASPHFGERWARHWLDLVRYAETRGHEFDYEIPDAWRYRDYLIRAFNDDLPYDQLLTEHIAGDLLPNPRMHPTERWNESLLATGWWFLGEGKHSPVDVQAEEVTRIENQIDVFGKAFLGLTIGCARCHDHKFDPILQADFYALSGYMQSTRQDECFIDDPALFAPGLESLDEWQATRQRLVIEHLIAQVEENRDTVAQALAGMKVRKRVLASEPQNGLATDFRSGTYEHWYTTGPAMMDRPTLPGAVQETKVDGKPTLRLNTVPQGVSDARGERLPGTLRSETFDLSTNRVHYRVAGENAQIRLVIDGFQLIRNPIYGGLDIKVQDGDEPRWMSMDVSLWKGRRAYVEVLDNGGGWFRLEQIALSDGGPPETHAAESELGWSMDDFTAALKSLVEPKNDEQTMLAAEVVNRLLAANVVSLAGLDAQLAELNKQRKTLLDALPNPRRGIGIVEGTPEDDFLYIRGNHKSFGAKIPRRFLASLGGEPDETLADSGRLELARQLTDPSNPLVSRAIVNRLWHHLMGRGIAATVDDLGVMGQPPTHPELLDWLARDLIENGWSLKSTIRQIVLSETYRQSGQSNPEAVAADPTNALWHHRPPRRLDAEAIRDGILLISGRLDSKMYGPSVLPHLTRFMEGRGRPSSGPLDGNGRRSVYVNIRRNFLPPMFLVFDFPLPATTFGRRAVSNVPAQALTMLNDPFVLEEADRWGSGVAKQANRSPEERIEAMYLAAFARKPTDEETAFAMVFLQGEPDSPGISETRWRELAHVLLNLKEFVYVR